MASFDSTKLPLVSTFCIEVIFSSIFKLQRLLVLRLQLCIKF